MGAVRLAWSRVSFARRAAVAAGAVVVVVAGVVSVPSIGSVFDRSAAAAAGPVRTALPASAPPASDHVTSPSALPFPGQVLSSGALAGAVKENRGEAPPASEPQAPQAPPTSGVAASRRAHPDVSPMTAATQYTAPGVLLIPTGPSSPGARIGAAVAYDSYRGIDISFGGKTSPGAYDNSTWLWNGSTWTLAAPAASPSARTGAMMAFNGPTNTVILFGGVNSAGTRLNDTWSWNGSNSTWTQLSPPTSPSARAYGSVAYDAALGEIVLMGGSGSSGVLGDTWIWKAGNWASASTPVGLSAREYAGMAYDATGSQVVLFGGDTGSAYLGDTWLFGSSGWSQGSPAHGPSARTAMGMAYDATLGRVVLEGGQSGTSSYDDQWMWSGSDWYSGTELSTIAPSAYMSFTQAAGGHGQLLLEGGYDPVSSTWFSSTVVYDWDVSGATKANTQDVHALDDRSQYGVNAYNTNLRLSSTDLSASGVGEDLNLTREFNSTTRFSYGNVGTGWFFGNSFDTRLTGGYTDSSVMLFGLRGTNYESYFAAKAGGGYTSPAGLDADLVYSSPNWTLTYHSSSEKLTFNSSGLLVSDVDRNGDGDTFAYSGTTPTSITDGHGRVYTIGMGGNGLISTITAPGSKVVTYTQTSGLLTQVSDAASEVTNYSYPSSGVQFEDPNTSITAFAYTGGGITATLPETAPNTVVYVPAPLAALPGTTLPTGAFENSTVTDANSHVTTYNVSYGGQVLKAADPLSHIRSATFSPNDDILTAVDAIGSGNTTNYAYDAANNPTSLTIPTGAKATAQYASGSGCSTSDTTHPYLAKCASDAQSNQGTFTYDGPGNVTNSAIPSAGVSLTYTYNPATPTCGGKVGQLCSSKDGNGHTTSFAYNSSGDLTTITPPAPLGATTQTFDSAGRVATVTDGKGQKTTYSYDGDDRVTQVLTGGATTCVYTAGTCVGYTYDPNGNRTYLNDKTGQTTYKFDVMNRETKQTLPSTATFSLSYDSVGNVLTYVDAAGTVTYKYNNANQLTSLAEPGGSCTGTISLCTTFTPNNNGQRTVTTYPGGTTMTDTLDNSGRPTEVKTVHGSTVIADLSYTYTSGTTDTELAQTRVDHVANLTTAYSYDYLDELTKAVETNSIGNTTASWLYCLDKAGNRTGSSTTVNATCASPSTTYTYNNANQLTAVNGSSTGWSYDLDGNETTANAATPRTAEAYTANNQLSSLTVGGVATAMTYTDLTNTDRVSSGSTTFQNAELGLANQTISGSTTSWTRDPSGTLISERASGSSYYYVYDGIGSVIALVNSAGTAVDTYSYDPYGVPRTSTGSTPNPYRYTAGYNDGNGLTKFGARYYDPTIGRFTQPDPSDQETNTYAYAGDDPVNRIDTNGTKSITFYIDAYQALDIADELEVDGNLETLLGALPIPDIFAPVLEILGPSTKYLGVLLETAADAALEDDVTGLVAITLGYHTSFFFIPVPYFTILPA